ncbi:MAG TPA: undecaprenyldiphospho-muramoylpentapeptide beta-N-acetylglucosaminyltransferase [Microscillaceae bacterium]|nr:undecaprenyldiphospho-muramoylpentapeptide beta-N-acetylglucosaminyltransferase [Microscillaceae bacterium]
MANRYIISGGGTGGHVFPAIAIAHEIKLQNPQAAILFVGALGRMEMEKVPAAGYSIEGLWISGIQRRLTIDNLSFPFKVISSLWKARKILKQFKPDVAIGVGGYASGPLLWMAASMGIPTLIQEQNSFAGLTNKWLSKKVNAICVAFEGMEKFFPAYKIKITGNPVRREMLVDLPDKVTAREAFGLSPEKPTLLVVGGSLGARTINQSIEAALPQLQDAGVQIIWQTGKAFFEQAKHSSQANDQVRVFEFIHQMAQAYAAADVVVARAGALSIAELCCVKKACILVPSPHVTDNHQMHNAMALANIQAALVVPDAEAKQVLSAKILALLGDEVMRNELAANIQLLAKPDATATIVGEIFRLGKNSA